jgi:hypothetical protein
MQRREFLINSVMMGIAAGAAPQILMPVGIVALPESGPTGFHAPTGLAGPTGMVGPSG